MPIRCLAFFGCLIAASQLPAAEAQYDVREKIVYSQVGERELLMDAFVPKDEGTYPAVLVVHGGAWRSGSRIQLRGYAIALARMGFVCFAIDYRLAPKHKFPAQIEDCRAAVKWIRKNGSKYKADTTRLGAIGYSAGGHLVSLLATTGEAPCEQNGNIDTRIQCCVAGGAPTDFRFFPDQGNWAEYWMGGNLKTEPEKFRLASSTAFVDSADPPTFFFNGTSDTLVPVTWSENCYTALKEAGVRTEMYTIQGAGHMQAASDPIALKKAYEFLQEELKPTKAKTSEAAANKTKASPKKTKTDSEQPEDEAETPKQTEAVEN
ncbi:MAG: alpha/beta hydrolase [Rubripirellula sp.]|nr:alpha/beta hydrolase [Rubripirellula sp.]